VLRTYKRHTGEAARRHRVELAAVLWRFLAEHERCLAQAITSRDAFDVVTTVPSSDPERDEKHPLHAIVREMVGPTRGRYRRLLTPSTSETAPREFSTKKFIVTQQGLSRSSILLIDDTWTTGASAQSAAAALKRAGAPFVATVVIGRHVNRDWHQNDRKLRSLRTPYDWYSCALCATAD
jgi:predicted amidophosphoribosyltransferase